MTPKEHSTNHSHNDKNTHGSRCRLHKDWRVWVAFVLMLAGMLAYVLSDDEAMTIVARQAKPTAAAQR
jgi:hypothetical protein